jgi:two-component system CheB/CheR fusion protein
VRKSLALMLKNEGHHVTVAASGEAGLALVRRDAMRPDLVICDYNLAGELNGVQTGAALRAALGLHLPVIILTGTTGGATLRDIAESGFSSLSKPVMAEELLQVVQQLLITPQPIREEAAAASPAEMTDANATTVFVVDDNRDTRDAMRSLLTNAGYRVKTYASAKAFLDSYRPGNNSCLITDVRMPGMNGLEMLAHLATTGGKRLPTIVITGQGDIAMAVQAMRAGAADFIEKPTDPDLLLRSIRRALRQAANPADRFAWRAAAAMRMAGLTKREREVMNLVVAGLANKEIAFRLRINQRTVEVHRAAVMKKMGARSLADLVRAEMEARGEGLEKGAHKAP